MFETWQTAGQPSWDYYGSADRQQAGVRVDTTKEKPAATNLADADRNRGGHSYRLGAGRANNKAVGANIKTGGSRHRSLRGSVEEQVVFWYKLVISGRVCVAADKETKPE
jgi:hypothetical protein